MNREALGLGVVRLPTAAKGAVNLDNTQEFVAARLGKEKFGVEQLLLVVEHFEITCHATFITVRREARRIAVRLSQVTLLDVKFLAALIRDERVRHLAERVLNGLLITGKRFLKIRTSERKVCLQSSAGEQREADCRAKLPCPRLGFEKVGKRNGLVAVKTGEGQLWKKSRLRLADVGVRRDKLLFGCANVGAALD